MPKCILTVEDDPDILFIIEMLLVEEGYDVITSMECKGVMEKIQKRKPDLVLMDVRLPDGDGRDLCRVIKKQYHEVPIVLMSAHAIGKEVLKDNSVSDFLSKPFDVSDLVQRIKNFV